MEGAGLLSLQLLEREDEEIPANVVRLDWPEGMTALPSQSPELLLAMLMFSTLPDQKRESIRNSVRCMAYGHGGRPAIELNNALKAWRRV